MTRPGPPFPPRLRSEGGTPVEQRLLNAAARQEPSPELSARMAAAIGVVAPAPAPLPNAAPAPEPTPGMAATGTLAPKAAVGTTTLWPWISGLVVVAVAGAIVVMRPAGPTLPSAPSASALVASRPPAPSLATKPDATGTVSVTETAPAEKAPAKAAATRARPDSVTATNSAISEQIALVDAASAAVSAGAGERALSVLREYQSKYPTGSFRPEVNALRIEALMLVGRREEARSQAERFVSQYKGPLADRVARVAGLSR